MAFIERVIKFLEIPDNVKKSIEIFTIPIVDWQKVCWQESADAYVKYLYNLFQLKMSKNQLYENFNFQADNFSIIRFKNHVKAVLGIVFENINEIVSKADKTLSDVESADVEDKDEGNDSEWKTQTTETFTI